eukprot:4671315-Prymnesium_polylepis.1
MATARPQNHAHRATLNQHRCCAQPEPTKATRDRVQPAGERVAARQPCRALPQSCSAERRMPPRSL